MKEVLFLTTLILATTIGVVLFNDKLWFLIPSGIGCVYSIVMILVERKRSKQSHN
jgi:hypothetical protein